MKLRMMLVLAGAVLAGCTTHPYYPDYIPPAPPAGVGTSAGDNFIEVFWTSNRENDLAGYNVYSSAQYEGPFEYLGSTRDPYFNDTRAQNANLYYYAISAYDISGNESELSRDNAFDIPRPEGYDVTLFDYRGYPDLAGYDFSGYQVVPFDDIGCDIYFENYKGTMYIVVAEDTEIQDMGPTASIVDIHTAPLTGWSPTHDVVVTSGRTYVVRTWDMHYAKFRISRITSSTVVFDWAYQLVEGSRLMKPAENSRKPVHYGVHVR